MFKLALRNILRHRLRSVTTLFAIAFGVIGLILVGGFIQDSYDFLGEALIHSQTGHVQVFKQGFDTYGARSPEQYLIEQPDNIRTVLQTVPQLQDVMARVDFSGLLTHERSDLAIIGQGIEPEPEARLGTFLRITAGRQLTHTDHYAALIGHGVAQALKLSLHDQVTLLVSTPDGALNSLELEIIGIFQSFSKEFDARAVRIPLATAQELLGTEGVNNFIITLHTTAATATVANVLRNDCALHDYSVKTWIELNPFYTSAVDLYERQFGVFQLIILVLVILGVSNSVGMSVFERTGEFGTLKALGNRNNTVLRLVMLEGTINGFVGSLLGVLCGIMLALVISKIGIPMPPVPNSDLGYTAHIKIVSHIVTTAGIIGFVATLLASIRPALQVSRLSIVEALRRNI